jgi:hypothetical protein
VRNLSEESLVWREPNGEAQKAFGQVFVDFKLMRALAPDWGLRTKRRAILRQTQKSQALCHDWFSKANAREAARAAHAEWYLETAQAASSILKSVRQRTRLYPRMDRIAGTTVVPSISGFSAQAFIQRERQPGAVSGGGDGNLGSCSKQIHMH